MRAALLRLLADGKPFKDLTVDELARAAGLSRTAFYFYFPGKKEALDAAASEVAEELYAKADRWWHGEGPPEQLVRAALEGILGVYVGTRRCCARGRGRRLRPRVRRVLQVADGAVRPRDGGPTAPGAGRGPAASAWTATVAETLVWRWSAATTC